VRDQICDSQAEVQSENLPQRLNWANKDLRAAGQAYAENLKVLHCGKEELKHEQ